MKASGLVATERGNRIVVTFTLPGLTTEGSPIDRPPDVELRVGPVPSPWSPEAWAAASDRIPVPAIKPLSGGASGATLAGVRNTAHGASGARSASGAAPASGSRSLLARAKDLTKPRVKPAVELPTRASLFRSVAIDAAKYSGKTVAVGVRVLGPAGRDDGWSITQLEVTPPLAVPHDLRAADAPNAVHLQWSADAPAFRIFRKLPGDTDWTQIGESIAASFDDVSFAYGKTWQYYVESVRKAGDNWLESDPSETLAFTPVDRFPPAVPSGLIVITGTRTMELAWDAVMDADLAGYRVYRNGQRIADAVMTLSYSDKEVFPGKTYSYQVSAVDQAGNESKPCPAVEKTME